MSTNYDPALRELELIVEIDEELYSITMDDHETYFAIKIYDENRRQEIDSYVFTDDSLPKVYDLESLDEALAVLFQDVTDIQSISDIKSPVEWDDALVFDDLKPVDQAVFVAEVNAVVRELHQLTLYDTTQRHENELFMMFGQVVAKVEFRKVKP